MVHQSGMLATHSIQKAKLGEKAAKSPATKCTCNKVLSYSI